MLITIVVVLIILALALYGTQLAGSKLPLDGTVVALIQVVLVVIAIVYIASAAGIG